MPLGIGVSNCCWQVVPIRDGAGVEGKLVIILNGCYLALCLIIVLVSRHVDRDEVRVTVHFYELAGVLVE